MSQSNSKTELFDCSPANDPNEVFDRDELLNRCLGNLEFAERILERFSDDFTQKLTCLRQLADTGELEEMHRLTHQMKGTAANIAAHRLRTCLAALEDSMEGQAMDSVESLLGALEVEFEGFQQLRTDSVPTPSIHREIESRGNIHD